MDDIYKSIEEYNPNKIQKILIVFDMIADTLRNRKLNPIVSELFITARKINISLVVIRQFYFTFQKNIKQNSTHIFVIKISNKSEFQQITFNHPSDTSFQDFMNLYKKCIAKP